jgi:hypothetical protein
MFFIVISFSSDTYAFSLLLTRFLSYAYRELAIWMMSYAMRRTMSC